MNQKDLDNNMDAIKNSKARNSNRNLEDDKDKGRKEAQKQQLNFYQPSDGSSENLQSKSLEDDKINDDGEIIYQ